MRATERNLLLGLAGLALAVAFWFVVMNPKREKADELTTTVTELEAAVEEQEQRLATGEEAERDFASNYEKVVVLGKAAPTNSDTASFLVQLNRLAEQNDVTFDGLALTAGDAAPAAAPAPQPGIGSAPEASSQPSATAPTAESGETPADTASTQPVEGPAATAPATEAAVSTIPIGSGVGPAGLNTLKYNLTFHGGYFDVVSFMADVDSLVSSGDDRLSVDGRLSTVDGFSLITDRESFPILTASLVVTTFTTPAEQGLTAGASPLGPSASDTPQLAASAGATP